MIIQCKNPNAIGLRKMLLIPKWYTIEPLEMN